MSWRHIAVMNFTMAVLMIAIMYGFMNHFPMREPLVFVHQPAIVERISHEDVMGLLRETFPEAQIRGSEKKYYDIVAVGEVESFLADFSNKSPGSAEESDMIFQFIGGLKQPGWLGIPAGFMKADSKSPICPIVIAKTGNTIKVFRIDILKQKVLAVSEDRSVKMIAVLF
ncbi:MAG: hypothetical protein PHW72_02195 [Candidatus Pacebacteria bacterium]|nr:hypothetical protein [Candidatus Paceibacterota bacterium]